jgi:putative addiction module component (TIGR02574 family)
MPPASTGRGIKWWRGELQKKEREMDLHAEEIESAALQLTRPERARLAARLIASLDDEEEIEAAWDAEIERRVREVDSGEVQLIPGEQVMEKMRSRLRRG